MPKISISHQVSCIKQFVKKYTGYIIPNTKYRKSFGFTLIELLVVISIIGILVTVASIAYGNVRQKARDSQRKEELKAVKTALLLYYQDFGQYPTCTGCTSDSSDLWIDELVQRGYIKALPKDPKQASLFSTLAALFKQTPQVQLLTDLLPKPRLSQKANKVAASGSISAEASNSDGYLIYSGNANPPDSGGTCTATSTTTFARVGQYLSSGTYYSFRGLLNFDTSSVPDNATITSAALTLTVSQNSTITDFTMNVRYFGWTVPVSCPDDWGGNPPTGTVAGTYDTATLPAAGASFQISFTNLTGISLTGTTSILLASSREEANTAPTGTEYFNFNSANNATVTLRPVLQVNYTTPDPTPTPTPTPSPTPSPTPPPPSPSSSPAPSSNIYNYVVADDRKSFVLWAILEKSNDPEAWGNPGATCSQPLPDPNPKGYNYCIESPG